jgi:hypothetical protein
MIQSLRIKNRKAINAETKSVTAATLLTMEWIDKYQVEISHAKTARQAGNEGMARVCARRAAGVIIFEYFGRLGEKTNSVSAYDLIRRLKDLGHISPEVKQICEHLLLRVTPDYQLPAEADLINDVEWLNETLLG